MIVYGFNSQCYKCRMNTYYYTYLIYNEYHLDVEFPIDFNFMRRVYAEMPIHTDDPFFDLDSDELNYPVMVLGDNDYMDDMIIKSGFFPNIKKVKTRLSTKHYAANTCENCGALLGNYHLRELITDKFLKTNRPMERVRIL